MKDLILALPKANSSRSEKRTQILKIPNYQKLVRFLESRFNDGETYTIKNYFEDYKLTTKDQDGNDNVVYGFIVNEKTYLSLSDLSFPKRLWKREIKKVDGKETTTYTQEEKKVYQGDLAILFDKFKSQYKDLLLAFDLLYIALAEHNESKFTAESFVYPTEIFQRFKGEYVTSNFYLFNLQIGGTSEEKLNEIFDKVCKFYEESLKEAGAPTEDMKIKQIEISLSDALSSDIYMKKIPLIKEFELETKEAVDIKSMKKHKGQHYGHEWVDLGLPSGVKWATSNVGASFPEEYGNYYAWGETCMKSEYTSKNISTYGKSIGDISGNAQYDVARKYWGGSWRMPTKSELQELEKKCSWKWTTQNEIKGCKVTGPNGNSIFLPAAGHRYGTSLNGAGGRYSSKPRIQLFCRRYTGSWHSGRGDIWSSTPSEDRYFDYKSAYYLAFFNYTHEIGDDFREVGRSVRPVLD